MRLRQTLTPPVLRITTDGFEKGNKQQTGGACVIQMRTVSKSLKPGKCSKAASRKMKFPILFCVGPVSLSVL